MAQPNPLPEGFRVPAEDIPHLRTFMQWPVLGPAHDDADFVDYLQDTIARIANTIAAFEPVVLLMGKQHIGAARQFVSNDVEIWDVPTDDLWCRDSGPLFARNDRGGQAVVNLNFNGWGDRMANPNDRLVAARVAERLDLPVFDSGIVGEPGGVEWDGDGTLLAHESSWVNPNRNTLGRSEIEARLLRAYGAEKMIWAPGVAGQDITDDHIDALARFTEPGTVLFQAPYPDDDDVFSNSARVTLDILKTARDARGRRLEIVEVPSPEYPRIDDEEFVSSYANYYVCNGAVICAEFGDMDTNQETIQTLKDLYPDREVVSLNVDALGETGGGIHCATQQQPA
ncbi:agmatine deiminase [Roseibium denhamense]|uniref:Agmatine deiminase n=2 Tax=Roseibium denhamense TaxID=76305 RepID=A0ABY1NS78_9HYPH|nr:agmatine deiminase [Roseibium denhamense]